MKRQPLSS